MAIPTYAPNGSVNKPPYTFTRSTPDGLSTLNNRGTGNPVQSNTSLLRSSFRPSDDATIFQFLIPSNMMFAHYLSTASAIAHALNATALASEMSTLSTTLTTAITTHGIITSPTHGSIYAYEVDGYGSRNMMDDANIPSLLSAPFFGYLSANDTIYQNTRSVLLSANNPYFMRGPVINANGGPHDTPGYAWPMASIVRILTSSDDNEIYATLKELVSSTNGLGLMHESINTFNAADYTRPWYVSCSPSRLLPFSSPPAFPSPDTLHRVGWGLRTVYVDIGLVLTLSLHAQVRMGQRPLRTDDFGFREAEAGGFGEEFWGGLWECLWT
jgi:meiotically up-regulated gene 157 (Mug157) protein